MFGPTPGEQYLAHIDLPEDYYPAAGDLRRDLDDAILDAAELVIAEWKHRDPLLRALLADSPGLNTWATYPAGQLPAGALIRVPESRGVWEGKITGETHIRYSTEELRIDWTWREHGYGVAEPTVRATTEVDAWVPIPLDLSAVLASVDGYPKTTPPAPVQRRSGSGAVRLTPPMIELLADIATHPEMFITYQSRWSRTAIALCDRKLATKHFSGGRYQYEVRITDAGREEAIRRGIIDPEQANAA